MSVLPQFLGMRVDHDEHRQKFGVRTVMGSTWSDCDACLAIAMADEVMRALESLTPGGSEFHQEPGRCVQHVREVLGREHRAVLRQAKVVRAARVFKDAVNRSRSLVAALGGSEEGRAILDALAELDAPEGPPPPEAAS